MLFGACVEEQSARTRPEEGIGRDREGGDGILKREGLRITPHADIGVHADALVMKIVAEELTREKRDVGQGVGLHRERVERSHGKRHRLVFLDQIHEPVTAEIANRAVRQMRRPPRGRDEGVTAMHRQRDLAIRGVDDRHALEEPLEAGIVRERTPPSRRVVVAVVHDHEPNRIARVGQPERQVELAEIAREEMLNVDGRCQQIHAPGLRGVDRETERRDLPLDDAQPRRRARRGTGTGNLGMDDALAKEAGPIPPVVCVEQLGRERTAETAPLRSRPQPTVSPRRRDVEHDTEGCSLEGRHSLERRPLGDGGFRPEAKERHLR